MTTAAQSARGQLAPPMRILIADDEPLALRRLRLGLAALPDVQVVAEANDGAKAIALIRAHNPDVVLLDVKMPLADGFKVVEALADLEGGAPAVIFVTAFDSYALRAFETSAVDYLLKPVEFDRLAAALERARARRDAQEAGRRADELAAILDALRKEASGRDLPRYDRELWVRDRGRFLRVPVSEIDRIEAERDYVRLYWEGRTLLFRETMASLEDRLDPDVMLRVHRSTFVNWARLKAVRRDRGGRLFAVLENGSEAAVSRAYAPRVLAELRARDE